MEKSQLLVAAIQNGTVIDHIPTERFFDVINILKLHDVNSPVIVCNNLESKRMGKKGIIKVADRFFSEQEIAKLAVVAPNINVTTIKDYEVIDKRSISMPQEVIGIVKCPNPKCITNNEPMRTRFVSDHSGHGLLRCCYCNKLVTDSDIKLI